MSLQRLLIFFCIGTMGELAMADSSHHVKEEGQEEPAFAVLFPSFTLTIGVISFYLITRYAKALPYTAVMFLLGTIMGITAEIGGFHDHVGTSLRLWININSEVLLLVFLPGLLFRDAMSQNVYLFFYALSQLLIFAFPMVLAGTVLTAFFAFYVFPYGWPLNLAMTFGAILAATDPVAVAALLEEVGAPPRLKVHIAGESLLNDGAAIVFYSIFSQNYFFQDLAQFGTHGEDVDVRKGFEMFFQKALGGFAVGLFFGIGQLMFLFYLNRRANREENIVQVTSLIAMAYLNFYTADFVWKTSGVISTVTAGLVVKVFGRSAINDSKLLEDFSSLFEYLLNTILFTLGGAVWGAVVVAGEIEGKWNGKDWGYLIVLYIILHIIRGFLFILVYPISSRIGIRTNPQETFFQVYGGLRGALGIALAIALDNEVGIITGGVVDTEASLHSTQVFVMIGGIALLTLVINGITAGPILRKLGLANSTETRKKIVLTFKVRLRAEAVEDMVMLLTQPRFRHTNFALIQRHVPFLQDLTRTQLLETESKHRSSCNHDHTPPFLGNILPYLPKEDEEEASDENILQDFNEYNIKAKMEERAQKRKIYRARTKSSGIRAMLQEEPLSTKELRLLFVSILKAQYDKQILRGELEHENLLAVALTESLDLAAAAIEKGNNLKDWRYLVKLHDPILSIEKKLKGNIKPFFCFRRSRAQRSSVGMKTKIDNLFIERSMAFMSAHEAAQKLFLLEMQEADKSLGDASKIVIQESATQVKLAQDALKQFDPKVIEIVSSLKMCKIITYMAIHHVEKLVGSGLLKESEAEHFLEELEEHLDSIYTSEEEISYSEHATDNDSKLMQRNFLLNTETSILELGEDMEDESDEEKHN